MFSLYSCVLPSTVQRCARVKVGDSKLAVEVNLSVSPCVSPVTDWQPV